MKNKIILSLATLGVTCAVVCLSLLGTKLINSHPSASLVAGYGFTNYNASSTSPLVGNSGSSASAISNGEVAYGTTNAGLSIGTLSGNSYTFNNFTTSTGLKSNNISALAFNTAGVSKLAVGENNTAGTDSAGLQIFSNVNSSAPSIVDYTSAQIGFSGPITGVSFYYNNGGGGLNLLLVSYGESSTSTEGGLAIGTLQSNNSYTFQKYDDSDSSGFTGKDATCVAIITGTTTTDNIIAVGTKANGFNIGVSSSNGSGPYTFTNYNSTNESYFDSEVSDIAFSSAAALAITFIRTSGSTDPGLVYSPLSGSSYSAFTPYLSSVTGSSSNSGTSVAFGSNENIAFATSDGGVSVGSTDSGSAYTFTNYNTSDTNSPIDSDNGKAVAFQPEGKNQLFYVSDAGLDIGAVSDAPSVSFKSSDFRYIRNESNKFVLNGVNFTTAFVGDNNPDGYYVQMLFSADGDSSNPFLGIYMTNNGTTPTDAPTTGDAAFDVTINKPASDHDYSIPESTISNLAGNTKYDISITYGNSQTDREQVATPTFTTPKLLSNEFDSSTITYANNENNYATISAIDFNFNTDLENVSKNGFYVLITITNSLGVKLAGLYITISGENPTSTDQSIGELLPAQAITSTATSYSATNLTTKFESDTTYTVNYAIGTSDGSPDVVAPIGNGVSFTTPKSSSTPIQPNNNPGSNTGAIVGGVVGGVGGAAILGTAAALTFLIRRKRKRA